MIVQRGFAGCADAVCGFTETRNSDNCCVPDTTSNIALKVFTFPGSLIIPGGMGSASETALLGLSAAIWLGLGWLLVGGKQ